MTRKNKLAPQEEKHRRLLKSLGIKPLPKIPKQKKSLEGQIKLFEDPEEEETNAPEDSQ